MTKRDYGSGGVNRRLDGRWEARLRYTDPRGRKRRAVKYAMSERDAKRVLREMRSALARHGTVAESAMTVGAFAEQWISTTLAASARRPTTKANYSTVARTHIIENLGHHKLKALTVGQVEHWTIALSADRSPSTVRLARVILGMILDSAMKHDLVQRNVAKMADAPPTASSKATFYTSDQVAALRRAAEGERLETMLTVGCFTGLRKGELLALRWEDVELGDGPCIRVTGTLARVCGELVRQEPKTASGRRFVPLVPEAADALRRRRQEQRSERMLAGPCWSDSGYVFTTEGGGPLDPRNVLRWFYAVRGRAGLEAGSWHSLRHAVASVLLSSGTPMVVVRDVLGHSSIRVTVDTYGHLEKSAVAGAMSAGLAGFGGAS